MKLLLTLHDALFPPRASEKRARTATLEMLALAPTIVEGTDTVALLPYRDALVQALVVEAKFHRNRHAQALLAAVLTDYLSEALADSAAFEARTIALVPIPLSSERRAKRGYNQAEDIAHNAAEHLPQVVSFLPDALTRVRDTVPQTTLGRALRLQNMIGAFRAEAPLDPSFLYIVIDDVATTGATLSAASAALSAAGALHVRAIALAH